MMSLPDIAVRIANDARIEAVGVGLVELIEYDSVDSVLIQSGREVMPYSIPRCIDSKIVTHIDQQSGIRIGNPPINKEGIIHKQVYLRRNCIGCIVRSDSSHLECITGAMRIYEGVIAVIADLPGPICIVDILWHIKSEMEGTIDHIGFSTVQNVIPCHEAPHRIIIIGKCFHPLLLVKNERVHKSVIIVQKCPFLVFQMSRYSDPLKG